MRITLFDITEGSILSVFNFLGAVQHSTTAGIVTSKPNSLAPGQLQRIMVRQPDGTNVQLTQQIKQQQNQQGRIIQTSSGQIGSQTKMISAAELQKLISSGAVKTVTRTTGSSHPVTNVPTTQVVRQINTQQERILPQQQPVQQQVSFLIFKFFDLQKV